MTSLFDMLKGKPKLSEEEKKKKIEDMVNKIAIKHSIPQHTIRSIVLEYMIFQKGYLKYD